MNPTTLTRSTARVACERPPGDFVGASKMAGDVGSGGILVLATALAICLAVVLAIGPVVRVLSDRQHAQSAADAAALSAVLNDCGAARAIAGLNRALLISCERSPAPGGVGFVAVVVAKVGAESATARASSGA